MASQVTSILSACKFSTVIQASVAVSIANSTVTSKINLPLEKPIEVFEVAKKESPLELICNSNALTLTSLTDAVKQDVHLAVEYQVIAIMIQPSFHGAAP